MVWPVVLGRLGQQTGQGILAAPPAATWGVAGQGPEPVMVAGTATSPGITHRTVNRIETLLGPQMSGPQRQGSPHTARAGANLTTAGAGQAAKRHNDLQLPKSTYWVQAGPPFQVAGWPGPGGPAADEVSAARTLLIRSLAVNGFWM